MGQGIELRFSSLAASAFYLLRHLTVPYQLAYLVIAFLLNHLRSSYIWDTNPLPNYEDIASSRRVLTARDGFREAPQKAEKNILWLGHKFLMFSSGSGCSFPGQYLKNSKPSKPLLLRWEAATFPANDLNLTPDHLGPDSFAKYLLSFNAVKASLKARKPWEMDYSCDQKAWCQTWPVFKPSLCITILNSWKICDIY